MEIERIPLPTQTLYAELLERLTAREASRSIGSATGCFTTKTVKDEPYYYFQYSDPGGRQRQVYVGKKSPILDRTVETFLKDRTSLREAEDGIQKLCAQLRVGGALTTDSVSARVLKALAEGGFFKWEGVLVGTTAFTALGNLLGRRWRSGAMKTQDIDLAGYGVLQVAVPDNAAVQTDVPKILEGLRMGFVPIPALNLKHPSTSFSVRGSSLRVDLLTPEVGRPKRGPVMIRRFNAAAQALRFLDFLIEAPQSAAIVDGSGILVNIPHPARFAFHKLLISQERAAAMHAKSQKDLFQACQIFSVLCEERPGDVTLAWEDLESRGAGWVKRAVGGTRRLKKIDEPTYKRLIAVAPELRSEV